MSRFRATSIAVALCVSVTAGLASSNQADASTVVTHRNFYAYPDYPRVVNYMEAVVHNQIVAAVYEIGVYVTGMEAERAAQAERDRIVGYVRSQQRTPQRTPSAVNPPAPAPAPRPAAPASSGGACGGATNGADQFIQRESGGDSTVTNGGGHAPSPYAAGGRAWGCYQIMPYVWAANCGDLGFDTAGQAACASRLPLSAWRL